MSLRRFEHKLAVARVQEEKLEDLTKYISRDKVLKENFKSDDRSVTTRVIREQREVAKEHYTAAQLQAAREAQERTLRLRAQDERLAADTAEIEALAADMAQARPLTLMQLRPGTARRPSVSRRQARSRWRNSPARQRRLQLP